MHELHTAVFSRMCEKLPLGGFRGVIVVGVIRVSDSDEDYASGEEESSNSTGSGSNPGLTNKQLS